MRWALSSSAALNHVAFARSVSKHEGRLIILQLANHLEKGALPHPWRYGSWLVLRFTADQLPDWPFLWSPYSHVLGVPFYPGWRKYSGLSSAQRCLPANLGVSGGIRTGPTTHEAYVHCTLPVPRRCAKPVFELLLQICCIVEIICLFVLIKTNDETCYGHKIYIIPVFWRHCASLTITLFMGDKTN